MSQFKPQAPVVHIPSFPVYKIDGAALMDKVRGAGLQMPFGALDRNYYYTSQEGWGKILFDLVFKSSLYKEDKFDCDNYAMKALTVCAERYGLNTMGMVIGNMPLGRHAWNLLYTGKAFLCFEANTAFPQAGEAFKIGEHGYIPEVILV